MSDSGPSRSARLAWTAVVVILLGAVGLVTYALTRPDTPVASAQSNLTSPAVIASLSTVPESTFDAVGVTVAGTELTPPQIVTGQPPLTTGGLPEVLSVSAEFCPFCAAERWPLIVALARFGHFTVLHDASSAPQSVFPGTPTFSFAAAKYTSPYVTFTGVELYSGQIGRDGSFVRIATVTPSQAAAMSRAGITTTTAGTVPFVDINGQMVATTSAFSPALLAGQSQSQIAGEVAKPPAPSDPTTATTTDVPTGPAIIAAANQLSAGICVSTNQRPASVCRSKGVRAADASLGIPVPALSAP